MIEVFNLSDDRKIEYGIEVAPLDALITTAMLDKHVDPTNKPARERFRRIVRVGKWTMSIDDWAVTGSITPTPPVASGNNKAKPRIIIEVDGGLVTCVHANRDDITVDVLDHDNYKQLNEKDPVERERRDYQDLLMAEARDMPFSVY